MADILQVRMDLTECVDRFNKGLIESVKPEDNGKNRLKTVILQRINNATINASDPQPPVDAEFTENAPEEVINMDF